MTSIMNKARQKAAQEQAQQQAAQEAAQQLRAAESDYAAMRRISGGATGNGTAMESNIRAAAEKVARLRKGRR